jgi:hydrogenase nickel incorporation protein HypA/HybF
MHELAVTESILEIALRHANQSAASKITTVYLVIGELSSIIDDSVQFYWEMIARDTIAETARLVFRRTPISIRCQACGRSGPPVSREDLACPACGSIQILIETGEEFTLEAIDIETS